MYEHGKLGISVNTSPIMALIILCFIFRYQQAKTRIANLTTPITPNANDENKTFLQGLNPQTSIKSRDT